MLKDASSWVRGGDPSSGDDDLVDIKMMINISETSLSYPL